MFLVKIISALKDIVNAKKSLQLGIEKYPEDCSVLLKELDKIKREITKLTNKLKEEMRLKGFKSLKERVKLVVEDVCQKENEQPTKTKPIREMFKTSNTFDFRNYSTEFLSLNKNKNDKKEIVSYRNIDSSTKYKKISFGSNQIVRENLKELYKLHKLQHKEIKEILKPILKMEKKKKLKQIIREEIKSKFNKEK